MIKLKLLGIGKSENRCYYILPKKQKFFSFFRQFLLDLGIKKFEADSFARPLDKKFAEPIFDKEDNIKKYVDVHYSFVDGKKQYLVDLVFGKNSIFLIIFTKKDKQDEISKLINKFLKN